MDWTDQLALAGQYMPLTEELFDWLVSLSFVESFEILCWLGLIIRAKVLGLHLSYDDFRRAIEPLNQREHRISTRNRPARARSAAASDDWSSADSHSEAEL